MCPWGRSDPATLVHKIEVFQKFSVAEIECYIRALMLNLSHNRGFPNTCVPQYVQFDLVCTQFRDLVDTDTMSSESNSGSISLYLGWELRLKRKTRLFESIFAESMIWLLLNARL